MEMLHDSGLVGSLDLVELNPFLDERGKSARLLTELVTSLFGPHILDRPASQIRVAKPLWRNRIMYSDAMSWNQHETAGLIAAGAFARRPQLQAARRRADARREASGSGTSSGSRYLDCLSAYSAVNQGHCHPKHPGGDGRAGAAS